MKFTISEGKESEDFLNNFIELYEDTSINVKEICQRLDISQGKYLRIKQELINEGKITDFRNKKGRRVTPKWYFYSPSIRKWVVQKNIQGKFIRLLLNSEEECIRAVELFDNIGWRRENIATVKRECTI